MLKTISMGLNITKILILLKVKPIRQTYARCLEQKVKTKPAQRNEYRKNVNNITNSLGTSNRAIHIIISGLGKEKEILLVVSLMRVT